MKGSGFGQGGVRESMKLDRVGMGLSALCAVHCAVLPLFAGASLFAEALHTPWVEASMIGSAGLIGYFTLGVSYQQHRRRLPLVLLTLGLLLMGMAHTLLPHAWSTPATFAGAALLVLAQVRNRRCPAPCCSSGACDSLAPQRSSFNA